MSKIFAILIGCLIIIAITLIIYFLPFTAKKICYNETITEFNFPEDFRVIECPIFVESNETTTCYASIGDVIFLSKDGDNYVKYQGENELTKEVCKWKIKK
jgi:hypothetical protein